MQGTKRKRMDLRISQSTKYDTQLQDSLMTVNDSLVQIRLVQIRASGSLRKIMPALFFASRKICRRDGMFSPKKQVAAPWPPGRPARAATSFFRRAGRPGRRLVFFAGPAGRGGDLFFSEGRPAGAATFFPQRGPKSGRPGRRLVFFRREGPKPGRPGRRPVFYFAGPAGQRGDLFFISQGRPARAATCFLFRRAGRPRAGTCFYFACEIKNKSPPK